jgi:hypothetical protein
MLLWENLPWTQVEWETILMQLSSEPITRAARNISQVKTGLQHASLAVPDAFPTSFSCYLLACLVCQAGTILALSVKGYAKLM